MFHLTSFFVVVQYMQVWDYINNDHVVSVFPTITEFNSALCEILMCCIVDCN